MRKIHLIFISVLIVFSFFSTQAQIFKKVPKQYSLEIGPRNLFSYSNITLNNSQGFGGLFDYAWQLSGFDGTKNASFISVPMGYTILPGNYAATKRISMLNYGWTVRHELARNKKIIPFVGYGLFLNDLKIKGTEGSVFGHQTEFDFGLNFNTRTRLKYFVKLQYSYTSYPRFNEPKRIKLHYADLRLGVRF